MQYLYFTFLVTALILQSGCSQNSYKNKSTSASGNISIVLAANPEIILDGQAATFSDFSLLIENRIDELTKKDFDRSQIQVSLSIKDNANRDLVDDIQDILRSLNINRIEYPIN